MVHEHDRMLMILLLFLAQDKWRNMSLMASGSRSCRRVRPVNPKTELSNKLEIASFDPREDSDMKFTTPVPCTIQAAPLLLENGSSKMPRSYQLLVLLCILFFQL